MFPIRITDYGARQYDARLGVWHGVDPLSEENFSNSPYAFCNNNAIKHFDSDGRKVFFAPGTSQEFKDKFSQTVKYMNERGSSGDLATLEASDNVYYIHEKTTVEIGNAMKARTNSFSMSEQTIYWDPDTAFQTDEGIWLSPATVLAHEVGHAKAFDKNPSEYAKNVAEPDKVYKSKEERRNITTTEQRAAKKHHEIRGNTVTRKNHKSVNRLNVSNLTPYETEAILENNNRIINDFYSVTN